MLTGLQDPRNDQIAMTLVDHSTRVTDGDRVVIVMREPETFPIARAVSAQCTRRGAYVQTLFYSAEMQGDILRLGSDQQVGWVPELWHHAMEWADVCIDIRGFRNRHEYEGVSTEQLTRMRQAEGEISAMRTAHTRWTLLRVPNEAFAQQAGKSMREVSDFFYRSVLQDWDREAERYEKLRSALEGTQNVRIVAAGTDLSFSTAGRRYIVDDGRINMPGGEVFTAPVEESVNGTIQFEHPGVFAGVFMEDIRLTFTDGVVTDATAASNETFLHQLLDMDDGSRRVGEFGIGTNGQMTFFTNDILYDEKILGTIHIALGRSYTECGGINQSSLHWDIVKDLRTQGTVYIDGEPAFETGVWTAVAE
ncbi:MAG: aminopeptidase [Alkalispirochaeta sp.]